MYINVYKFLLYFNQIAVKAIQLERAIVDNMMLSHKTRRRHRRIRDELNVIGRTD